jgi:hypothetical protein
MNEHIRARLADLLEAKARQTEQDTQQPQHVRIEADALHNRVAVMLNMTVVPVLEAFCQLLKTFRWRTW